MTDTFRKEQKPLSDDQKSFMHQVKTAAEELERVMNMAVPLEERSERSRNMAIARTNLEQAIMWAVKGITSNE